MEFPSNKPVQRATWILLKYALAATVILCLASQFRWLDVVWTNTFGYFDFTTNQTGAFFIFQPPQPGMGSLNQLRTGEYDDEFGVPNWERRFQFFDSLRTPVFSGPGIGGLSIYPPAVKYRFYALYLNHSYVLFFAAAIYSIARFSIRRRVTGN